MANYKNDYRMDELVLADYVQQLFKQKSDKQIRAGRGRFRTLKPVALYPKRWLRSDVHRLFDELTRPAIAAETEKPKTGQKRARTLDEKIERSFYR